MRLRPSACCALALIALTSGPSCAPRNAEPHSVSRASIELPLDTEIVPGHVTGGENFGALLRANQVSGIEREAILASLEGVFDARHVREGQAWRLIRDDQQRVRLFEYEIDGRSLLRVAPRSNGAGEFAAEVIPYDVHTSDTAVAGDIDDESPSLFAAMAAVGEQADLSVALADIFSGEVDFNTELQPGDQFELLVEKAVRDGRFVGYGPVEGATIVNGDRRLAAYRFQPIGGQPGYYDADGRSLKRFFLRSPLKFDPQVSSGFSRSRLHPILNIRRAHLGVDYRAPAGAPVVAVSNGTVTFAGWTGGGGRTVRIRHASGYESGYLHLSAFAAGIRAGAHVSQGQLIGRVGATGLATGAHLHYELRKAGVSVNPLVEQRRLPPGEPVPGDQMDAFRVVRDAVTRRLAG
jgi:murein DD-endopeptidase MepM/ murein hydrolase activator NlpD